MGRLVILFAGVLLALAVASAQAQVAADSSLTPAESDVTASDTPSDLSGLPSPNGALWRSLAVPGWGQVYVGQPVKAPFVIGALGGLAGLSIYLNSRYTRYRHAYLYVVNEETPDATTPNPNNPFASFFQDWIDSGAQSAAATRQLRDDGRRNRDLTLLGTGLVYALQALDAYVAAHLVDFDVSEDLSLHLLPSPEGPQLVAVIQL